jgi:hypothetical protein
MTENEMTGLLLKLADRGVTGIKVKYEGGGDSGAIEWIGYTTEKCNTPEDVNDRVEDWETESNLANLDGDVYYQIESFAENKLLNDVEDWWNDEGGYGELSICVPSGKYMINNNIRVTHSENYLHEGDLISQTLK